MSLQELKTLIIDRVTESTDEICLGQLAEITQTLLVDNPSNLGISETEWEAVKEGRRQLANGEGMSHDQVFESIRTRLIEKYGQK